MKRLSLGVLALVANARPFSSRYDNILSQVGQVAIFLLVLLLQAFNDVEAGDEAHTQNSTIGALITALVFGMAGVAGGFLLLEAYARRKAGE